MSLFVNFKTKRIPSLAAMANAIVGILLVFTMSQNVWANELTYERDVRPILKAHCFHCHGEGEELEGGLDVRLRRLIVEGGDSGSAVEPGDVDASLLYERLSLGEMPPEEVAIRPTDEEIDVIRQWIAAGANTARPEPEDLDPSTYITEEERDFWSFQPVRRVDPPSVANAERVRTAIDQFLLAKLVDNGLTFSEDANRRTLLRRAYFDLAGLPPSPNAVTEFLNDDSPNSYERLIDRLLDSPHYGERWGRHWLDVAGYADSEGGTDDDAVRGDAWKYRDYVIRSFNADKPFDQFIQEQLAGDEMVRPPYGELPLADIDKLIATGFLRMAPDGTAAGGVDQGVARNQVIADTIQIVSTSLMGLTVGCAQCHNHRYDPIPQTDYYRMRAIFEPAFDWQNWRTPPQRRVSLYTDAHRAEAQRIEVEAKKIDDERTKKQNEYIEQTFEKELAKLAEEVREPIRQARTTAEKDRTPQQKQLLKDHPSVNVTAGSLYLYDKKAADDLKRMADEAENLRATKPKEEYIRALTESAGKTPPKTFLFHRGDHEQRKQELQPAVLTVFSDADRGLLPDNDPSLPTTGRRLAYAKWLTSGDHPLVARVIVNRVWLHYFGRGIVDSPGDFGFLGSRPTHPELLDWLAAEFINSGWSVKHLHRLIMTSTAYRQSSQRHGQGEQVDADNRLYWRMNVRRVEAELLRDSVLAVSGDLNRAPFGPPVPVMADKVGRFVIGIENLNAGRPGDVIPMHGEEFRRSIYVQVRRSRPLSVLDTFDAPRMEPNCTSRSASTVAPQSLMLMNSDFVIEQANKLAARVQREIGNDLQSQVQNVWLLIYARYPSDDELRDATDFVAAQTEHFVTQSSGDKKGFETNMADAQREALASLCHALLSSNEFLYID